MSGNKKSKANEKEKSYYHGHRERLRERFLENGIDSLLEHEILELILFFSIPRRDTKPLAHALIDSFGSLKNVFNASPVALKNKGLSAASIVLLSLFSQSSKWISRNSAIGRMANDYNEIGRILAYELDCFPTEHCIALLINSKNEIVRMQTIGEGSFATTAVNLRSLMKSCFDTEAAKVILAHNHPSGDIRPSANDRSATAYIEKYLSGIDVELVESYIIANATYFGIKKFASDMKKEMENAYPLKVD